MLNTITNMGEAPTVVTSVLMFNRSGSCHLHLCTVGKRNTQGIAFLCKGPYTEAPAQKPHKLSLAKVSRAATGTVLCGPPPQLSLFFRSVRGLPRQPSATFFPSIQSLRGPAKLGLRDSHAWGWWWWGVRKYQGLWSTLPPAPRLEYCNTGRGEADGGGGGVSCWLPRHLPLPAAGTRRNRNLAVHTKATGPTRNHRWLCVRHVAPAAN